MKHVKTFENFLNEAGPALGPKTKKFDSKIDLWDFFVDADDNVAREEPLPKEWHTALKTLGIKAEDAIVLFFDAHGDRQEVLDTATKCGLTFTQVENGEDSGSGGILFSFKQ